MRIALTLAALLLAGPAVAGVEALPDSEVCADYAATILSGHSYRAGMFHVYSERELAQEMTSRGLTCDPMDRYFEIARYRLGRQERRADAMNAFYQQQQRYYQQQRDQTIQQQQIQQQQNRMRAPVQTTCTQTGSITNCTTTGG